MALSYGRMDTCPSTGGKQSSEKKEEEVIVIKKKIIPKVLVFYVFLKFIKRRVSVIMQQVVPTKCC